MSAGRTSYMPVFRHGLRRRTWLLKATARQAGRRGYDGDVLNKHCKGTDFLLNLAVKCRR